MSAREADRARVAEIDIEIRDLEGRIHILRVEREAIQERIQTYIYPVLSLPTEITPEIFLQLIPLYPDCPPLTGSLSPSLLTHICRQWRNIALDRPILWRAPDTALERTRRRD
ncbi:hypothetical protein C8R43DRAFT_635436 [Mycena crocata]|nr:hypothetical protein C8R43DRAFT_635436 [Mycena crocata]